jgi:hypothetical protein
MAAKNGRAERIITAKNFRGNLSRFLNDYTHQPDLTGRLDNLGETEFTQELLNEIVLWKVNRYVLFTDEMSRQIGQIRRLKPNEHRMGESVLTALLDCRGVDLAMASTILRFRNPAVFQIVDRHAYRAIYGSAYPLSTKCATDRKVSLYFDYLDALVELCAAKRLAFKTIDRVLYKFDQAKNGKL